MLLNLLQQYVSRVIIESRGESEAVISRTSESELDGITRSIYSEPKGAHQHSTAGADLSTQSAYVGPMRDALPQLFQSLYYQRSQRLAELQTSYPAIHWIILSLLASSIIINFLIESDSSSLCSSTPSDSACCSPSSSASCQPWRRSAPTSMIRSVAISRLRRAPISCT